MSFHDNSYVKDVISMDYMFAGTSMRTVDFSNVNFEKVTSIKYMFANGLMEEFSYTVPNTIISIQGFLSGCSKLKTLRNFTISSNVSTLDWLADTNVENLIDCSFNTLFTKFTNNTSLKVVENLEYTGSDFSNYFSGCTSLQRVSLALPNTTTKAENTFANCPNLTRIDFTDSDLSNVTSINGMFNGDTSLTTINNLKIVKSSTTANNTTLVGCPISNTDGLYINSNNALNMFRLGAESAITAVTDFELGSNANNLSQLFMNNPNMTHDIVIPSHVHTVEKMYYNCPNLTYVNSNWSNVYSLNIDTNPNNDVITANCYGECTNIQYIDNELYMNEYGELTAIYAIPEEWGGILNCSTNQTAFYINSDLLTEYTITLNSSDGVYTTEWGDGTTDKRVSHTYSKSGSFRIVTNNSETFGTGNKIPDNFRTAITRVLHLDETITNGSHLFEGCTNLLEIKPLTNTFNTVDYMFNNCNNLLDVDMRNVSFGNYTSATYMCNGCSKFTKTPISVIPDTCTNISYLFANSGITDISGMTFGSGISNATSWIPPKLTTANNVTIKNNYVNFNGCSTLISCDNLIFTGTNMNEMFNNCGKLQSVENLRTNNKVTNYTSLFRNCGSLGEVDFINIDFTSATVINYMLQGLKNGAVVKNIRFGSNITSSGMDSWMKGNLKNIENIYIPTNTVALNFKGNNDLSGILNSITGVTFSTSVTDITGMLSGANKITEDFSIPSHITNCTNCFKDCTSMTRVHSNWNNAYTNGITATDCYAGCNAITHIDDKNAIPYEGANGLDTIPTAWGGNGFLRDRTGIYVIEVPNDSTEISLGALYKEQKVNWGDGTITTGELSHTYKKAGVYNITGMATVNKGYGTVLSPLKYCLKKVLQIPTNYGSTILSSCTSLEYADLTDGQVGTSIFYWCTSLKYANVTNIKFVFNRLNEYFCRCINLETIVGLDTWDVSLQKGNWSKLFYECHKVKDLSGVENWTIPATDNMSSIFEGCSSVTSLNLSNWDISKVTNLSSFVSNCSQLNSFYAPKNINVSLSDFTASTLLTSEHLMSIINNLNTVTTAQTLKLGSTNLSKLSSDQIAIAINKNWTVV